MGISPRSYSLYELVASVRRCIEANYIDCYWVRAETSGLNLNSRSGHCYLELEERDARKGCIARVKAYIWRDAYERISLKFRQAGLPPLSSGMNILCSVQLKYHELYGLSLVIQDIDTSYSLGENARIRQETINKLKSDGVWSDNKQLALPIPLQRLAIISSATAAGYGDFYRQLHTNSYGLKFYTALFVAQMQGEGTGASIIQALERIAKHKDTFDAVVIIRGGGAVSELRAFDDYQLCYYATQYPLPIISGIGHDRDVSILDMVAHTSVKTPTAVAEFLIHRLLEHLQSVEREIQKLKHCSYLLQTERQRQLSELSLRLPQLAQHILHKEHRRHDFHRDRLTQFVRSKLKDASLSIEQKASILPYLTRTLIEQERLHLQQRYRRLSLPINRLKQKYQTQLEHYEQNIRLAHPQNILNRGFALVKVGGRILGQNSTIKPGEELDIQLGRKLIRSKVKSVNQL